MPIVNDDGVFENEFQAVVAQYGLGSPTEPAGASESIDWGKMNQEFGALTQPRTVVGRLTGSDGKERYQTWPEKAVRSAVGAMTLPGDVSQGKVDPSSSVVVDRAADLAGTLIMGGGSAAKAVGVDGTLGSMAGVRAATLPRAAYDLAVDAEKQGFNSQEIFKSTGFFKGADGQWRFEIDDSGAKYFPENLKGGQKLLSDVLSHKELFEAYPDLRSVKIRVDPSLGAGASYTESSKLLLMGPKAVEDKSILVHEIQHAIQGVEGTNRGGTPGKSGRDYNLKYEEDVNKLRPEFLKLQGKEMQGEMLSEQQQSKLDYLRAVFKKYTEYSREGDKRAIENYEALAGEVEARNAQHRVDLTPQERMRFNPVDTEYVARNKQLVRQEPSLTTPYVVKHPYDKKPDFHTY